MVRKGDAVERLEPKYHLPKYRINEENIRNSKYPISELWKITKLISDGTHFTPKYTEEGVKFLSVKDVRAFEINYINSKFISKEEADFLDKRCKPKKGDVLLTKIGTTGLASVIDSDERFQIFVSVALVRPNINCISPEFIALCLNSNLIRLQFERVIKGSGVPDLHLEDIRKIITPVPSIETQSKIVNQFQFAAKKQKEAEAAALLASIDGYLLQALGITLPAPSTPKKCFYVRASKVNSGRIDPYFHQNEFQELEEALRSGTYEIKSFKQLAKRITSGATPKSGGDDYTSRDLGIPFIRSGEINEFDEVNLDKVVYIKPSVHNSTLKSSQLKKNDLMIAIVGATIGQVGVFKYDFEANINQAIALIRFDSTINVEFVKSFLKTSIGQKVLDKLKRPVARANINLDEISSIKIPLPPLETQTEIANHISQIRTQAKALQQQAAAEFEQAKQQVERLILGE